MTTNNEAQLEVTQEDRLETRETADEYLSRALSDMRAEIEKLPADFPNYGDWPITIPAGHWRTIADRLTTQSAREKLLVEALRPFAEACAHLHPSQPDDGETLDGFKVSDFRHAATLLAQIEGTKG